MTRTTIGLQVLAFIYIFCVYAYMAFVTGKSLWLILLEPFR